MSDTNSTDTGAENTGTTPPAGTNTGAEGQGDLPEWARDKLTKANNEAASYRVKAREAGEQLDTLRAQVQALTDEKTAALDQGGAVALELAKLQTALSIGVPGEQAIAFAELLKGDSLEEIKQSAEKAKTLLGSNARPPAATDRSQGQGSSSNDTPADEFHGFVLGQLGR